MTNRVVIENGDSRRGGDIDILFDTHRLDRSAHRVVFLRRIFGDYSGG